MIALSVWLCCQPGKEITGHGGGGDKVPVTGSFWMFRFLRQSFSNLFSVTVDLWRCDGYEMTTNGNGDTAVVDHDDYNMAGRKRRRCL